MTGVQTCALPISYYVLKGLSFVGLVRDIKEPPARVKTAARISDGSFDHGMFRAYWAKATASVGRVEPSTENLDTLVVADPELATRREHIDELIASNRAALQEHIANALAYAEELGRLSRRHDRQTAVTD